MNKLFVYGSLKSEKVQKELFGKVLKSYKAEFPYGIEHSYPNSINLVIHFNSNEFPLLCVLFISYVIKVGVLGLEPRTSWSQTMRSPI